MTNNSNKINQNLNDFIMWKDKKIKNENEYVRNYINSSFIYLNHRRRKEIINLIRIFRNDEFVYVDAIRNINNFSLLRKYNLLLNREINKRKLIALLLEIDNELLKYE